jgi:hypothetical protein
MFGDRGPEAAQPPKAASPQPPAVSPTMTQRGTGVGGPSHVSPAHAAPPAHVATAAAASVNGQLAGKLGELGLSAQQVDAVLALSREVVEKVVWEVVPQLAETLIKEEIARLMKDG